MHFSDSPSRPAPARLAFLTVCALLPFLAREASAGGVQRPSLGRSGSPRLAPVPPPSPAAGSAPYLHVGPPPGLRFAEPVKIAAPIPSPITRPDPPHADDLPEEVAALEPATSTTPPAPLPSDASDAPPATAPVSVDPVSLVVPEEPPQIGVTILPDDTPRPIRAEDVLVYFRFPVSSPSGGPPPRSSATYQQK